MLNIKRRNRETTSFSFRRNFFFDIKKKVFLISKKLFLRDKEKEVHCDRVNRNLTSKDNACQTEGNSL